MGGHKYPGHTEILAELTDTKDYAMMLVAEDLRVIHVSTHVPLKEAIERAQPERELAVIRLARDALLKLGVSEPKIAVAGINPHAGENGLFGSEDAERIRPAIVQAMEEGIEASGPWAADTSVSHGRAKGEFDMVVVQYHDQGHVPIKLLSFESGVNVTVGLPFLPYQRGSRDRVRHSRDWQRPTIRACRPPWTSHVCWPNRNENEGS